MRRCRIRANPEMTGVRVYIDATWMQKGLDALNETFCVDDATRRDMIQFLFDEGFWDTEKLTWSAAVTRFNECLNPRRPQFFKFAEIWALMKRFRRYALLHAMVEDLEFQPLRPQPTESRRQDLLERIARAEEQHVALVKAARAELGRLDADPPARRMNPAFTEGDGSFCRGHGTGGF
jgi:hypothetical protein